MNIPKELKDAFAAAEKLHEDARKTVKVTVETDEQLIATFRKIEELDATHESFKENMKEITELMYTIPPAARKEFGASRAHRILATIAFRQEAAVNPLHTLLASLDPDSPVN